MVSLNLNTGNALYVSLFKLEFLYNSITSKPELLLRIPGHLENATIDNDKK